MILQYGIVLNPSLKWDKVLNMIEIMLELIPDPDMFIFFEKLMGGRVSYSLVDIAKPTISI